MHDLDGVCGASTASRGRRAARRGGGPRTSTARTQLRYSGKSLVQILCPPCLMCHQKFELFLDDLAFFGHPACADPDGVLVVPGEEGPQAACMRSSKKGQSPQEEKRLLTPERAAEAARTCVPEQEVFETAQRCTGARPGAQMCCP